MGGVTDMMGGPSILRVKKYFLYYISAQGLLSNISPLHYRYTNIYTNIHEDGHKQDTQLLQKMFKKCSGDQNNEDLDLGGSGLMGGP